VDVSVSPSVINVCGTAAPGTSTCDLLLYGLSPSKVVASSPPKSGYSPAQLTSAYNLAAAQGNGAGQTVAVVAAYGDSHAQSDLDTYRAEFSLPPCDAGCFTQVGENGGAPPQAGNPKWVLEQSLDTDMVSAICPRCHILLVDANSDADTDLGAADNEAAALGATEINNSFGGPDSPSETATDPDFDHPGVVITASSGDNGRGVQYPADAPGVVAVGGTTLSVANRTARGWNETAWSDAGSGCSTVEPAQAWQQSIAALQAACPDNRATSDVAADADPHSGVAIYDGTTGWEIAGGTSASSPMIAAVFALAGGVAPGVDAAQYLYGHAGNLYDVTSGNNGRCSKTPVLCTAGPGWDGPTGLGTPDGIGAFLATTNGQLDIISSGPLPAAVEGIPYNENLAAAGGSAPYAWSVAAGDLPQGLVLDPGTGAISGTPSIPGTSSFSLAVQDASGTTRTAMASIEVADPQPAITADPTDESVLAGQPVQFSAAATGDPVPSVQWQVSSDDGATFTTIRGAKSSQYSFTSRIIENGYQYRAVFTNDAGSAVTSSATLTVSRSG
jgi:hypothetical protein